jgi:hypothetical protein
MAADSATAFTSPPGPSFRSVLPSLVVDGLCPFLTYELLMWYVPDMSQVVALGVGAIFPAVNGVASIARRRHLDFIGAVVLVGLAVSIVATIVSRDAKILLIRESFVTGALGVLCLLSLLWPRPLMFYVGRQFSAGQDAGRLAEFDAKWSVPGFRRTLRVLTIVWAIGWIGEFALRVVMVWTLSVPQVLAISPFVFNGITLGLIAWTVAYARRKRQRAA